MSIINILIYERMKQMSNESEQGIVKLQSEIYCLTIIGEIEGHTTSSSQAKTTKYEHIIPKLAKIEENEDIKGLLILLNTVGGDVEAGLAISEMIASLSKPSVSIVLGGGHSIGVPLAVSATYSFIVPSAAMTIHPVRTNGTVIGAPQSFEYFIRMQKSITHFITKHSKISASKFESLMFDTKNISNDIGTLLYGEEAVKFGLINEIGGIKEALSKLKDLIEQNKA